MNIGKLQSYVNCLFDMIIISQMLIFFFEDWSFYIFLTINGISNGIQYSKLLEHQRSLKLQSSKRNTSSKRNFFVKLMKQ